jgi:hypothetical protein
MNIAKHLKDSSLITELAGAAKIRSARAILAAVEGLREEKREIIENHPQRNDQDLTKDWVYISGMIRAFNIVLSLPKEAQKYCDGLPETGEPK